MRVPPRLVSAAAVRIAIHRHWAVLDKSLLVYGPQVSGDRTRGSFERVSIVPGQEQMGLLVDPRDPRQAGSFAAFDDQQRANMAAAAGHELPMVRRGVTEIPPMFPWSCYQVSPVDQRCGYLNGDEWVVLDGVHPQYPRVQSRLPGVRAEVRVYPPGLTAQHGPCYQVAMQADRLNIDANRLSTDVLWRGSFPVADEATARALTVVGGVVESGQPLGWPTAAELVANPVVQARGLAAPIEVAPASDSMAKTLVREEPGSPVHAMSPRAVTDPMPQGQDADTPGLSEAPTIPDALAGTAELGVTDEGVLTLSDEHAVVTGKFRTGDATGHPVSAKPVSSQELAVLSAAPALRPMIDAAEPANTSNEPANTSEDGAPTAPPNLPQENVDRMKQTLSDSLDEFGHLNATFEELSWRLPK